MTNQPLVSIIIPVYNGSDYLGEAIDSALAQTYPNVEILVINDGSGDNGATRNIALSYGDKIRYLEKENGGVATALNLGISEMKGEYFSWLSHDDVYLPGKIKKQVEFISKKSLSNAAIYSDVEYIDKDSKVLYQSKAPHYEPNDFRPAFLLKALINGCTLLVPKICFKECGVFNPALKTTQDYDLWFRISEKFGFVHQPEVLIQSRLHDKQDSIRLYNISFEERDNLYHHFISGISPTEICRFSKHNPSGYYISFAFMMAAYMCPKAEKHAAKKAVYYLLKSRLITIFPNIFKLILLFLFIAFRKLFIALFGYMAFFKFKKALRFSGFGTRIKKLLP